MSVFGPNSRPLLSPEQGSGAAATTDRFRETVRVFSLVIAEPLANRSTRLQELCGQDEVLLREVEAMLAQDDADRASGMTGAGLGVIDKSTEGEGTGGRVELSERARRDLLASMPRINGQYRIIKQLGEGGMGVVYLAEQMMPRRLVAIKALRSGLTSQQVLSRFAREAHILGRLQHPHIAQVYEAGVVEEDESGQAFIVMEFVDGRTLTQHAQERGLSVHERLELFTKVCDAVHHAHQRRVIHRDLKPGNILVDPNGAPKVLDFGVASLAAGDDEATHGWGSLATQGSNLVGTLAYMPPEQFGESAPTPDTRSDVYSLGVVLYELLTDRLPVQVKGLSIIEAGRAIREQSVPRLIRIAKGIGKDADAIVSRAMHRDPERRYQSVGELAADIRRALAGEAIVARQDSALYVVARQLRRHWVPALTGACILAGLIGFAIFAAIQAGRQTELARQAVIAREQAQRQAAIAQQTSERLSQEVFLAGVERARLELMAGNSMLAEDLIWGAHFEQPSTPATYWALRELYYRNPTLTTAQVPAWQVAAVTPDGATCVCIERSGRLVTYEFRTMTESLRFDNAAPGATALAASVDSIAVGLSNGTVRTFRTEASATGSQVLSSPVPDRPDASTTPLTAHKGRIACIAIDSRGTRIASIGDDKSLRLWKPGAATPDVVCMVEAGVPLWVALSPDGAYAAVSIRGTEGPSIIALYRTGDGAELARRILPADVFARVVEFSTDGTMLGAACSDRFGELLSMPSLELAKRLDVTEFSQLRSITWSRYSPGMLGILGSSVKQFASRTGVGVGASVRLRSPITMGAWATSDRLSSVGEVGELRTTVVGSRPAESRLNDFPSWCFDVSFSPDGSRLAIAAHGRMTVIDPANPAVRIEMRPDAVQWRSRCVEFLPDGERVLIGSADGALRLFDASSGSQLAAMASSNGEVYGMAASRDGRLGAAGYVNGGVTVWDLQSQQKLLELPRAVRRVEGVAFSSDGRFLATTGGSTGVRIWNIAQNRQERLVDTPGSLWGVEYSANGRFLAATGHDGNVVLFDAATFDHIGIIRGHGWLAPGLAVSPDSSLVMTGSEDGYLKLWDVESKRSVFSLDAEAGAVVGVAFDPKGRFLAASGSNNSVVIYDLSVLDHCIEGNAEFYRTRLKAQRAATKRATGP